MWETTHMSREWISKLCYIQSLSCSPSPSANMRKQPSAALKTVKVHMGIHVGTSHAGTLISDFWPPELGPILWRWCTGAQDQMLGRLNSTARKEQELISQAWLFLLRIGWLEQMRSCNLQAHQQGSHRPDAQGEWTLMCSFPTWGLCCNQNHLLPVPAVNSF